MAIDIKSRSAAPARATTPSEPAVTPPLVSEEGWLERLTKPSKPIGPRERMFFTERLSLLLETGVPLHVALESLATQVDHGEMASMLRALNDAVKGGATFSRALGEYPQVFPPTYVNLIGAAETGGFLPIALERLRDAEERREELRSTLVSAITYPVVLTVFSVAVVLFVLVVVFPKFEDLFTVIQDQLPITTKWLMATSDVLRRGWLPILIGVGGGSMALSTWLKRTEGAAWLDRVLLAIPGLRDIVVQLNVVQMLRVMGLSLGNGVGMVSALQSARDAVSSPTFRQLLVEVERGVNEGQGLRHGFNRDPLVPDLVKQMIETGEESGKLPVVMTRLADFYEREWRRALGLIAKVAEPAMLIIMGCVVGLIVSSLILPIFKLSRAVH